MLPIQKKISAYNYTRGNNIQYIAIHDVGTRSTAKNNVDYFSGGNRNASAHYFVDDASIWQSVEDSNGAWHVGDGYGKYGITNTNSIGIEMCLPSGTVTDKTEQNTIELVQYLMKKYNIPVNRVVRHYDASRKNCPAQFNLDGKWTRWNAFKNKLHGGGNSTPVPSPSTPTGKKNGIAIDNVSKDQATKMVQRLQTKYAWTLLRDQVKAVKQNDGRYTLVIKTGNKVRCDKSVLRLKQELKSYYPGYMQQNVVTPDGDKPSIRIEARNMPASAFTGKNPFDIHMRNFLKDILLDGQTYAETNSYGTYDVRVKGEGFNDHDAPIVLKEIQEMGKAKDIKINSAHTKGFKF